MHNSRSRKTSCDDCEHSKSKNRQHAGGPLRRLPTSGPVIVDFQNKRSPRDSRCVDPAEKRRFIPLETSIHIRQASIWKENSTVLGIELARETKTGRQASVDKITSIRRAIWTSSRWHQKLGKRQGRRRKRKKGRCDQLRDVILPKELNVNGILRPGSVPCTDSESARASLCRKELYGLGTDARHNC